MQYDLYNYSPRNTGKQWEIKELRNKKLWFHPYRKWPMLTKDYSSSHGKKKNLTPSTYFSLNALQIYSWIVLIVHQETHWLWCVPVSTVQANQKGKRRKRRENTHLAEEFSEFYHPFVLEVERFGWGISSYFCSKDRLSLEQENRKRITQSIYTISDISTH